jgi:hypothetical protein
MLSAYFADWWSFAGFHAAVFAGVLLVMLFIQWMRGGDGR